MRQKGRGPNKSPPIFSHEFIIQNHADIVSCMAMVFIVGLLFQFSSSFASSFIVMQHNFTVETENPDIPELVFYKSGPRDICAVFFYFLIAIVMHAVIQEYVLDKTNRKMHLSKMKQGKFYESGQLLAFYLVSVIWAVDIIYREGYVGHISLLWEGYPEHHMPFVLKFFFIIQMSYWLHCYPELYFQKTKKEDMFRKILYASLYLGFIVTAYFLNFARIGICLVTLHYLAECVFHFSRLVYFAEKTELATTGFMMWNVLFVLVRLITITLSVLTFWYGLELSANAGLDVSTGNFNTSFVRINCLSAIGVLQAWIMWKFITFHLKRARERAGQVTSPAKKTNRSSAKRKGKKDESASQAKQEDDEDDLPEVDRDTKARQRASGGSKGRK